MKIVFFALTDSVEEAFNGIYDVKAVACNKVSEGRKYLFDAYKSNGYKTPLIAFLGDDQGHKATSVCWVTTWNDVAITVQNINR